MFLRVSYIVWVNLAKIVFVTKGTYLFCGNIDNSGESQKQRKRDMVACFEGTQTFAQVPFSSLIKSLTVNVAIFFGLLYIKRCGSSWKVTFFDTIALQMPNKTIHGLFVPGIWLVWLRHSVCFKATRVAHFLGVWKSFPSHARKDS